MLQIAQNATRTVNQLLAGRILSTALSKSCGNAMGVAAMRQVETFLVELKKLKAMTENAAEVARGVVDTQEAMTNNQTRISIKLTVFKRCLNDVRQTMINRVD
jgi:hypothetical protein